MVDVNKPLDKKIFNNKSLPTCHDIFNFSSSNGPENTDSNGNDTSYSTAHLSSGLRAIVGLSDGQLQLLDPINKSTLKSFNDDVCRDPVAHYHFEQPIFSLWLAHLLFFPLLTFWVLIPLQIPDNESLLRGGITRTHAHTLSLSLMTV